MEEKSEFTNYPKAKRRLPRSDHIHVNNAELNAHNAKLGIFLNYSPKNKVKHDNLARLTRQKYLYATGQTYWGTNNIVASARLDSEYGSNGSQPELNEEAVDALQIAYCAASRVQDRAEKIKSELIRVK